MLQLSDEDTKKGNLIPQDQLDKNDFKGLNRTVIRNETIARQPREAFLQNKKSLRFIAGFYILKQAFLISSFYV